MLLDFFMIVSLVGWLMSMGLDGRISAQGVAFCLIGLVFLVAVARIRGINSARWVLRLGVPIASLAAFIAAQGHGDLDSIAQLSGSMGGLIFALFGFYLVFRAVFGARGKRARD